MKLPEYINKDYPTESNALYCLKEIKSCLENKNSTTNIQDYFDVVENYINHISKQRQEKRDLELKEIYSEVVKEYLIERAKLIKRLKSFISKNSLSSKTLLLGNNWMSSEHPFCFENDKPGYYERDWVKKEFIIQFPIYKGRINFIIPMEGSPLDLSNPYSAPILKIEAFRDDLKIPLFSKEHRWSFAYMESPWLVCNSILEKVYDSKSHHNPSAEFEALMLQILKNYPDTKYHK